MEEIKYRHEWKHELNYAEKTALSMRLKAFMKSDPHCTDGTYRVRSLYFDTPQDKALKEKIDGVNMREKFRIRFYNDDPSVIRLEKKSKKNGLGTKYSVALTQAEADRIVCGDTDWMMEDPSRPLLQELYCKMRYQGLRPKTIVDYTREPYIYEAGNVRVTLDYDIRTGLGSVGLFDPDLVTIPAGDALILLEVKWDEYLPSVIRAIVQVPNRRAAAFSKYAQCRIYG